MQVETNPTPFGIQNNNIIKPCVIEKKWRHCNVFISSSVIEKKWRHCNVFISSCVIEKKWRHCNVFISSSPCNVFTIMYSCLWQPENEDTVQQSVVKCLKIFLCLFTFCICLYTGEYCPLWRNFQPMTCIREIVDNIV